jgi:hypothetical protein
MRHLCQSASVNPTPHAPFLLAVNSVHSPDASKYEKKLSGNVLKSWLVGETGNGYVFGETKDNFRLSKKKLKRILGQECALEVRKNGLTSWIKMKSTSNLYYYNALGFREYDLRHQPLKICTVPHRRDRSPLNRLWQLAERISDPLHVTAVIFNAVVSMAQISQTSRPHFGYHERRTLRI